MSLPQEKIESDEKTPGDIKIWKRIIAELALRAPNQQIKSCIQTYDPENPTKINTKTLSKNFKKDAIIDTLDFLSKQKSEDANKDDLVKKTMYQNLKLFSRYMSDL